MMRRPTQMMALCVWGVVVLLQGSCARAGLEATGSCADVDCSGHGSCAIDPTRQQTVCLCEAGYVSQGTQCIENTAPDSCVGVTCSGHGRCAILDGQARCLCDLGYRELDFVQCVEHPGPCADIDCAGHGICIVIVDACRVTCACEPGYHVENEVACVADF